MGAAVRVVLQPLDLGHDAVLVAAEIDDAVVMLVASTLVTHGDVAVVVAPRAALLALGQLVDRTAFVQVRVDDLDQRAPAWRRGFDFDEWHLTLRREVDFLAWLKAYVSLFPIAPAAAELPKALRLTLDVGDLHALDLHF